MQICMTRKIRCRFSKKRFEKRNPKKILESRAAGHVGPFWQKFLHFRPSAELSKNNFGPFFDQNEKTQVFPAGVTTGVVAPYV